MRKNILLLESVTESALEILEQNANIFISETPFSGVTIAEQHPIHGIVTRGKGEVSQKLIAKCPNLQVIARCGVGLDNVDVDFATQQGIKVVNAPGSNAHTVAEHTLALMLNLQRQLYTSFSEVKKGNWNYRNKYKGDEIRSKTLGILGLGNIGSKVAKLADAFGMDIICWDKKKKSFSEYPFLSFTEVLMQADIITLHLPLLESTRNLISTEAFQKMQAHAFLINTARGEVVDQNALITALQNQQIAGFGADVLAEEPPESDNPLLKMDNVLITPHSASLTAQTYNEMCVITCQNIARLLYNKPIDERYIFNNSML